MPSPLESAHLADLHALAAELGVERYRMLAREELVAAITERDPDAAPPERPERPEPSGEERERDPGGGRGRAGRDRGGRGRREREEEAEPTPVSGKLEITQRGHGFIRLDDDEAEDVYVSPSQIRRCELQSGDEVAGPARPPRRDERYPALVHVDTINGAEPGDGTSRLTEATPAPPSRRINPSAPEDAPPGDAILLSSLDLLWPLGFGQRVRIDATAGSGRTTLLRALARALAPREDVELAVLLIDERPEEVAGWEEAAEGADVSVATAEMRSRDQLRLVEGAVARATRRAESGADVVLLVDSLSRIAVAADDPSRVKPIFGAGRETAEEDLGSLTVIATTLREGDAPDGAGRALDTTESTLIALDRGLAATGTFPAFDVGSSRIAGEEELRDEAELADARELRAELAGLESGEAAERLRARAEASASALS
jgi:transcription termination factor Rho